jgi:hypothetical protein
MNAVDQRIGRDDRKMRTRRLPYGRVIADADDELARPGP